MGAAALGMLVGSGIGTYLWVSGLPKTRALHSSNQALLEWREIVLKSLDAATDGNLDVNTLEADLELVEQKLQELAQLYATMLPSHRSPGPEDIGKLAGAIVKLSDK